MIRQISLFTILILLLASQEVVAMRGSFLVDYLSSAVRTLPCLRRNLDMREYATQPTASSVIVEDLSYSVGTKALLRDVNFSMVPGDRVTIVGENGVGKSTFLRILAGEIKDYEGSVRTPELTAYLPQSFEIFDSRTVLGHILKTSRKPEWLEHFYTTKDHSSDEWTQGFNYLGGHELFLTLTRLGLGHEILHRPLIKLSGGEKVKVHFSAIVHQQPELLLLDEPTNHLDLKGIFWLENYLRSFSGSVVMVTHDRSLINNASTRVSELSPITHEFQHFTGGYDSYLVQQEKIREKLSQKRKLQEAELAAISARLNRTKHQARSGGGRSDGDKLGYNARGERKQKGLGRQVHALQSRQDNLAENLIDVPRRRNSINIELGVGQKMDVELKLSNLSFEFPDKPLFTDVNLSLGAGEKICITGPNGYGKTSLLKIIAGLIKPKSGEVKFFGNVKVGFLDQEQESIELDKSAIEHVLEMGTELDENKAFQILRKFGVSHSYDLHSELSKLSIGTRRKVQLAGIVASGANILLLDEPTNHLDIMSLEQIENQLSLFPGIVVAVSHDRYFMSKLAARELKIGSKKEKREKNAD
ncbi:MAG: ATP-binding cassette domain-containing protein [Alphaproteobacteria bacterium]|nr:ATP-binding cassette domain-containing protein [Alphaproteobacteria bacterium]